MVSFNLDRKVKGNKKGFSKYNSDKRKTAENMDSLLKETGDMVTQDIQKAEVLDFFASVFIGKSSSHTAQVPHDKCRDWENVEMSTVED